LNNAFLETPVRRLAAGTLLATGLLSSAASAQVSDFDLVRHVPADVFMVTAERANPEHAFLDAHWAGVWEAFEDSGIVEDVLDLVAEQVDPGVAEMIMGYYKAGEALVNSVEWDAFEGQFVFGQRINAPVFADGNMSVGQNDYIMLWRAEEGRADAAWAQLNGMAKGFLGMISQASGMPMELQPLIESGVSVSLFDVGALQSSAPAMAICLLRHGDIMGLTIGSDVRVGVIELLAGTEGARSIADSPGFQAAFTQLPVAEDGFEYVDFKNLRAQLGSLFGMIGMVLEAEVVESERPDDAVDAFGPSVFDEMDLIMTIFDQVMELAMEGLGMVEYAATVHHTEGYSTHATSITVLADGVEGNLFYPLIGTSRPVEDFTRFLPATTTGYSVSGGTDLDAFYDFALELVGDFGPMGQMALVQWEMIQEGEGFDLREDVLSWIDGETITVNFELDGQDEWVSRMLVKDEAMAGEKLGMVLGMIPDMLGMLAEGNPMMMGAVSVAPVRDERFPDFHELGIAMIGESMLVGVHDGAMVISSSADALAHYGAVAAGEAEGIEVNETMMALALLPGEGDGAVNAASYTDHTGAAAAMGQALSAVAMYGQMPLMTIEEPEVREVLSEVLFIAGKLGPVISTIDFYRSSSMLATFDGKARHSHSVTHYEGPERDEEALEPTR